MAKLLEIVLGIQEVFAQSGQSGSGGGNVIPPLPDPLGQNTRIVDVLNNVLNFLVVTVAPPLAVILIVIGGMQMLFAGGDPEKFKTGKKTILYTAIGLAIVLVAAGIVNLIKSIITGS